MEHTETKQSNGSPTILQPVTKHDVKFWLVDELTVLAEALGETVTPARLRIYAADLCDLPQPALELALRRARRELKFFPKIPELRALAGFDPEQIQDAEARAAWDALLQFVSQYVQSDPQGNYGPVENAPVLSVAICNAVRRTGGWRVHKCVTERELPFLHKRFLEEYRADDAINHIDPSKLLSMVNRAQLTAAAACKQLPAAQGDTSPGRPVLLTRRMPGKPAPTEAELAARGELLKKQAEAMMAKQQNGDLTQTRGAEESNAATA